MLAEVDGAVFERAADLSLFLPFPTFIGNMVGLDRCLGMEERDNDRRNGQEEIGGAEEDRTPDLRIANATLSQLSYGPNEW